MLLLVGAGPRWYGLSAATAGDDASDPIVRAAALSVAASAWVKRVVRMVLVPSVGATVDWDECRENTAMQRPPDVTVAIFVHSGCR
jgi:hypothetical protein